MDERFATQDAAQICCTESPSRKTQVTYTVAAVPAAAADLVATLEAGHLDLVAAAWDLLLRLAVIEHRVDFAYLV